MIAATYLTDPSKEQRCVQYINDKKYKHGPVHHFTKEHMLKQAEMFDILVITDSRFLQEKDREVLSLAGVRVELI